MRVTWNGSLSFGLVSIPVGLAPATKPAARQSDVSFRLLHRECLTPIKQKRWCPKHDRELAPDEIVKGWEVAKGQYVIVEEAELEALERHDDSRTIDIERFVPLGDVDPVWMDRTYFLVPGAAPAQRRPYRLLLEAMGEAGVGGDRPVRPLGPRVALPRARARQGRSCSRRCTSSRTSTRRRRSTRRWTRPRSRRPSSSSPGRSSRASQASFEPEALSSDYRRDLRELLEAKLRGEEISIPEPTEEPAPAVDLIEALKASVAAAKATSARPTKAAAAKPKAEKRPARKAARK